MSDENKSREKCDPEVATATGKAFDELWNLDWIEIPHFPYVMKYKFDEDGYTLMASDLAAVYGEKLDQKTIQERFQILNPYAEMLPKVILKHVKQAVKNILGGEQAREETELKITLDSNIVTIQCEFNISGVHFIFNFQPQVLSDNQFKAHILSPVLLKALNLDEEKAALQRKVEELEGRHSSLSSSECSQRRNIKAIYSAIKEIDPPESSVIAAFLFLQKDKIFLPKSLEGTPKKSPTKRIDSKGVHSSSTSSSLRNRVKESKNVTRNIPYKEDEFDVCLESPITIEPSEEEPSIDADEAEGDAAMKIFYSLINNLSSKKQKMKESNKSPKREMTEEDSNEESASEPTPYLKPSPAKKKKLLKF